jgi:uncharacterized protein DUF4267
VLLALLDLEDDMTGTRIGTVLLGLIGLGITYIGIGFLLDPLAQGAGFAGNPALDPGQVLGNAKGVRDIASGVAIAVLLVARQRRVAGWFAIVAALIPTGDMLVVLANGGSVVTALAVHGATALVAVLAGVLLLRGESRRARSVRPAAQPVAS